MRLVLFIFATLILCVGGSSGQTTTNAPTTTTNSSPAAIESAEKAWSFGASLYTYIVPNGTDYAQPTLTFDYNRLHVEARYNYENLETGSAWIGYNFAGGDKLAWEFTPMVGGVFGKTDGVAPGYKGSVTWWKLELYSEGEYLFDVGDSEDSFFYNWSELTISPVEWFRVGMVTQRTRAYKTDRDIQRGFLVGFSYKKMDVTGYVLNPDESKPTIVL